MPVENFSHATDAVFETLRNPRRQFVLSHLERRSHPVTLTELARTAAAWETDTTLAEVDEEHCRRMRLALYHADLPKLVDVGLVEYTDDELRTVETAGRAEAIAVDFDLDSLVESVTENAE